MGSGYTDASSAYTYDDYDPGQPADPFSGLKIAENLHLQNVGTGQQVAGAIVSSYSYTDSGRLASATIGTNATERYTFEAAGNLVTIETEIEPDTNTWTTSATLSYTENRLTSMAVTGEDTVYFAFDAAKRWRTGQAPSASLETVLSDPNRTTFSYTGTGRLESYDRYQTGQQDPVLQAEYSYDASGQRTRSEVTDATAGTVTTTDFTYQGLLLQRLSATRTAGETTTSWQITYLYDEYGRPYGGLYRDTTDAEPANWPAPVFFAMVTTDRGDVVELLDANGSPFAAYRYDAWGNPLGEGNVPGATGVWAQETLDDQQQVVVSEALAAEIASRQVLRYASYCFDAESGMYYLSSRHYDPATRQFLSKDLSRNDGEQSAYQYCLGNPIMYTDSTGYRPIDPEHFKRWVKQKHAEAVARAQAAKRARAKLQALMRFHAALRARTQRSSTTAGSATTSVQSPQWKGGGGGGGFAAGPVDPGESVVAPQDFTGGGGGGGFFAGGPVLPEPEEVSPLSPVEMLKGAAQAGLSGGLAGMTFHDNVYASGLGYVAGAILDASDGRVEPDEALVSISSAATTASCMGLGLAPGVGWAVGLVGSLCFIIKMAP